jgi:signal transduction histidine kinase
MDVLFDYDPAGSLGPLSRERERAEQLLACYQQALGHELPNLLVALQGIARLLEEEQGSRLDPDGRALLNRLAELARRADNVARTTASVGRVCRAVDSPAPVSLTDIAREALAEVNLLSTGPGVEYDIVGDMPVLMVSRPALYQVLVELVGNAARARVPGQQLRVSISARSTPEGTELRVADNGRGVPVEAAKRLGQPFVSGNGSGLGLFFVRQLVARWGGALRVISEPGKGTVVTLLFREPVPVAAQT